MADGWVVTGPPASCPECRAPFTPSLVVGRSRKKSRSELCPRCKRVKKAARKKK